jgi:hypothetical protein
MSRRINDYLEPPGMRKHMSLMSRAAIETGGFRTRMDFGRLPSRSGLPGGSFTGRFHIQCQRRWRACPKP